MQNNRYSLDLNTYGRSCYCFHHFHQCYTKNLGGVINM